MESIGQSNNRQIFYLNGYNDLTWYDKLPSSNWVAFIICDKDDVSFMSNIVDKCLDKNVGYVCTAGKFCEKLHDIFDEEIVFRVVSIQGKTGKESDFEDSPMTVWNNNFSDGLWFAMVSTFDGDKEFTKLICIDFTEKGVKKHLLNLIEKINQSWLPSDEKFEEPVYDN